MSSAFAALERLASSRQLRNKVVLDSPPLFRGLCAFVRTRPRVRQCRRPRVCFPFLVRLDYWCAIVRLRPTATCDCCTAVRCSCAGCLALCTVVVREQVILRRLEVLVVRVVDLVNDETVANGQSRAVRRPVKLRADLNV